MQSAKPHGFRLLSNQEPSHESADFAFNHNVRGWTWSHSDGNSRRPDERRSAFPAKLSFELRRQSNPFLLTNPHGEFYGFNRSFRILAVKFLSKPQRFLDELEDLDLLFPCLHFS